MRIDISVLTPSDQTGNLVVAVAGLLDKTYQVVCEVDPDGHSWLRIQDDISQETLLDVVRLIYSRKNSN
jgi:hypothetical protein